MANNVKINESRDELEDEIARLETNSSAAVKPSLPKVTLQEKSYSAPDDGTLKNRRKASSLLIAPMAKKAFGKTARRRRRSSTKSATRTRAPRRMRRPSLKGGTRLRRAQ
ncbi:MAG: hypothetical protein K2I75_02375 [Clostridiales bacterium]|nr:hypothetical protein [Clostridiales bacterium]